MHPLGCGGHQHPPSLRPAAAGHRLAPPGTARTGGGCQAATTLRLEACHVDDTTAQITLRVRSTQTRCPVRSALSRRGVPRVPPAARAQEVMRQSPLPSPHLYRTAAHRGGPLGPSYAAARLGRAGGGALRLEKATRQFAFGFLTLNRLGAPPITPS
jgi:hypothetical protein